MAEATRGTRSSPLERDTTVKIAETSKHLADGVAEHSERVAAAVTQAGEIYRDATGTTSEDVGALLSSCSVVAKGMQDMQRAWIDTVQKSFQTTVSAPQNMLRCSSFSELAESHRQLLRESMSHWLEGNARLLRMAGRIAEEAAAPIEHRARR